MSEESLAKEKKLEEIRKEAEEKKCSLQRVLHFVNEFLAGPMCGKCYPCAFGTAEARIRLTGLSRHLKNVSASDIETLRRIGINMMEGSFCKKGKDTGKFIVETIAGSEEEFQQHLTGICPEKECIALVEYVINPELCSMCGKCSEVCKFGAIIGERKQSYLSGYLPFEIRQRRCTKCGECVMVCPTGAIEVITKHKEELVGRE
jgi:ferredoxin